MPEADVLEINAEDKAAAHWVAQGMSTLFLHRGNGGEFRQLNSSYKWQTTTSTPTGALMHQ